MAQNLRERIQSLLLLSVCIPFYIKSHFYIKSDLWITGPPYSNPFKIQAAWSRSPRTERGGSKSNREIRKTALEVVQRRLSYLVVVVNAYCSTQSQMPLPFSSTKLAPCMP